MATKGKDKIIDGQIAFDFLSEMEVVKPVRKKRVKVEEMKPEKQPRIIKFKQPKKKKALKIKIKRKYKSIKPNHLKKNRKVRRIKARIYGFK